MFRFDRRSHTCLEDQQHRTPPALLHAVCYTACYTAAEFQLMITLSGFDHRESKGDRGVLAMSESG